MAKLCKFRPLVFLALAYFFPALTMFAHRISDPDSQIGNILISCGTSGKSTSPNGRIWVGDDHSDSPAFSLRSGGNSVKSTALIDAPYAFFPPYLNARASRKPFLYRFNVKMGQKLIRLHFSVATFQGFMTSTAHFSVKAGPYILLNNFSPEMLARGSGQKYLVKEFCIYLERNQELIITISPSPKSADSDDFFAFINGIEIVSMPSGLYFTGKGGQGVPVVGEGHREYIDNWTAMELVQRLNVGGNSILHLEDSGMFRRWDDDSRCLSVTGSLLFNPIIRYTNTPLYVAPPEVYQTARSIGPENQRKMQNLTWKISVSSGSRYLLRLHFSELEVDISDAGERVFSIVINNMIAEGSADITKWAGGNGISAYRDYIVVIKGGSNDDKINLILTLQPKRGAKGYGGILNGLEVFKLSNHGNNHASANNNADKLLHNQALETGRIPKSISSRIKKSMEQALIVVVTLLIVSGYQLQRLAEGSSVSSELRSPQQRHQYREFSLAEIREATKHFSPDLIIGCGGFGEVYKGVIAAEDTETTVAIKRQKFASSQGPKEFWTEIKTLSKLRHQNLVTLLGFCIEDCEMILVYEYMSLGSLADHIKNMRNMTEPLSWERRLKIAINVARGLCYLHNNKICKVIHRDLKSSNILLGKNWEVKISDFGLCKIESPSGLLSPFSSKIKGTYGYLDPEYNLTLRPTWKSDVFAFGVVLLELISGRRAIDKTAGADRTVLAIWASQCIGEGRVDEIIDNNLKGKCSSASVSKFLDITYRCLRCLSVERPSIEEVLECLKDASCLHMKAKSDLNQLLPSVLEISKIEATTINLDDGIIIHIGPYSCVHRCRLQSSRGTTERILVEPLKSRYDLGDSIFTEYKLLPHERNVPQDYKLLFQLMHENLFSLKGYSKKGDELVLIYDCPANGTLSDWLHSGTRKLRWHTRVQICVGAARGLLYLHENERILTFFSSKDILLDDDWNAKLAGMGVPMAALKKERVLETAAINGSDSEYLDPEYLRTSEFSEMSDVYSFGVILLEVLSGRKSKNIVQQFLSEPFETFLDPFLKDKNSNYMQRLGEFKAFAALARNCICHHPLGRKRMSLVLHELLVPTIRSVISLENSIDPLYHHPLDMNHNILLRLNRNRSYRTSIN